MNKKSPNINCWDYNFGKCEKTGNDCIKLKGKVCKNQRIYHRPKKDVD